MILILCNTNIYQRLLRCQNDISPCSETWHTEQHLQLLVKNILSLVSTISPEKINYLFFYFLFFKCTWCLLILCLLDTLSERISKNLINNTAKSQNCYRIYYLPGLQKNVAPGNYGCAFAFLATSLYLNAAKHHKNQQELTALLIKRSKRDSKVYGPIVGRKLWPLDWTRNCLIWLEIVMNHADCPFKFQNHDSFDEMQKL